MYKTLTLLVLSLTLNAQMVAGVAMIVKDNAITLHDIKNEMGLSSVNREVAINRLIRKKLEASEIKERKISVSSAEIYNDIKETAKRNNLSVSALYEAALNGNGLTSSEFKKKVREKLLAKKLYNSIAFSKASRPTDEEMQEYYELHQDKFSRPESFQTVIYQSSDKNALLKKVQNPMFYAPEVATLEKELFYTQISPELATLLEQTPPNTFTQIVPDGAGNFLSFYLVSVKSAKDLGFENSKSHIEAMMMANEREQVLGDYFARLQDNAEIKMLRE